MFGKTALVALASMTALAAAGRRPQRQFTTRQLPAEPQNVTTITSPTGVTIRYKEPGEDGVCETTPGVKSYSGYVDLAPNEHTFFWFFESRRDPKNDPITLWLNGGPGSDSLIGLFQELGPCNVTEDLETMLNPYGWNEVSNMLFISQPFGVGFSYMEEVEGSLNPFTGVVENASFAGVDGRYAYTDATFIDTTELAAAAAWHIIQGFYSALPQLDAEVESTAFNLWTESYGGHYGPAFFNHFYQQNELIANGTIDGMHLKMESLGIINGIVDEAIQAPYYPKFTQENTYGIKLVNETVYNYMEFALNMPGGCLDQISYCSASNRSSAADYTLCAEATNMCRDNVESPYYYNYISGGGVYDIRHPQDDPTPPTYFIDYLNQPYVLNALGTDLNYTGDSSSDVYYGFADTGDFVWPNFIADLNEILSYDVRVSLVYGDADYICNWFGGEAVSLAADYAHSAEFAAAGYTPFLVDGVQYGETREYGNFSFTRIYEAGHEVPYYQPIAALQFFNRTIFGYDTATGTKLVADDPTYETNGTAETTHTETYLPYSVMSTAAPVATGAPAYGNYY